MSLECKGKLESETVVQTICFNTINTHFQSISNITIVLVHLDGRAWENAASFHNIYNFVIYLIELLSAAHVAVWKLSACNI